LKYESETSSFECGRRPRFSSRIGHGFDASPGEYPWMARIEIRNHDNQFIVCGGTLISDRHVLTAAHCLLDDNGYPTFQSLDIILGATDVSVENEPGRQTFGWKQIVTYMDWTLLKNDIAIITLSRPVDFTGIYIIASSNSFQLNFVL
jgi:secreted trypsin-like serine protease